jgi:hypothetical protein
MPPPAPSRGVVEQVLYTWSSRNIGSGKGVGFGAVSIGLRQYSEWLRTWPTARFEPAAPGVSAREAFTGWREAITHGAFAVGDWNVVYRKMPHVGQDGAGRDRFVVHALVGHPDDVSLAAVASDSSIWLQPMDCALDDLPRLQARTPAELERRRLEHDDDVEDSLAGELLRALQENGGRLQVSALDSTDAERTIRLAHIALPASAWPHLEVTSMLDRDGVTMTLVLVTSRPLSATANGNALASCEFHRRVETSWTGSGGWESLLRLPPTLVAPEGGSAAVREMQPTTYLGELGRRAAGIREWHFNSPLDDAAAAKLVAEPEAVSSIAEWFDSASQRELRAVFGGAEAPRVVVELGRVLARGDIDTTGLVNAWRSATIAPAAIAALMRRDEAQFPVSAVPAVKADEAHTDIRVLASYLAHSPRESVTFFAAGIIADRMWRRVFIESLLEAGARPGFVFDELLEGAGADERIYCEVALDHLDAFAEWLRLPDRYRDAFRVGLTRPSWLNRLFDRSRH